jgi:hypothetical protein
MCEFTGHLCSLPTPSLHLTCLPAGSAAAKAAARSLPTSPAGDTLLSFSLLNSGGALPLGGEQGQEGGANDGGGAYTPVLAWDFAHLKRTYLDPFITALAPAMKVVVQSQVGECWAGCVFRECILHRLECTEVCASKC